MKKTSLLLLLLLSSAALTAQNITSADSAVLNHILVQNRQYHTTQALFRHDRTKRGTTEHKYGTYYCQRLTPQKPGDIEAKIAMRYSVPDGDYYVITPSYLYNGLNSRHLNFNLSRIALMKLLANAMAWAVNGDVYNLCANFNVNFALTTDKNHYTITLTSKPGFNKGVSRLVMKYDRRTCLIAYLEMEEKLGTLHQYTMGVDAKGQRHQPTLNGHIDPSVYIVK